ncbi:MAG: LysR substrate-binding domain-containing protein [Aliidongia sp.]
MHRGLAQAARHAHYHRRLACVSQPARPAETPVRACESRRHSFSRSGHGSTVQMGVSQGRELLTVDVPSRLMLSDVGTMLRACAAGAGVAQVMALGSQAMLDDGHLIDLFPDWPDERFPLYALYPSRHQPPARVREFIEFALQAVQ